MRCPGCGKDKVELYEASTNRRDCERCGLAWLYGGILGLGRKEDVVITHYARKGDQRWVEIPDGCLLVLELELKGVVES